MENIGRFCNTKNVKSKELRKNVFSIYNLTSLFTKLSDLIVFPSSPRIVKKLPLTFRLAEWVIEPALFTALQVYLPICLWSMLLMTSMEILLPISVIVIPWPDVKLCPWNDQDNFKGSSPLETTHESWLNSPSFITSFPKPKGTIFGGSEIICKNLNGLCS